MAFQISRRALRIVISLLVIISVTCVVTWGMVKLTEAENRRIQEAENSIPFKNGQWVKILLTGKKGMVYDRSHWGSVTFFVRYLGADGEPKTVECEKFEIEPWTEDE